MKRILLLIILLLLLSSCGKGLETISSPYKLTVSDEFIEYFDYDYDIPNFKLEFDDTLNIIANWKKEEVIFSNNDDFKVSEIISNILNSYDYVVLVSEPQEMKTTKMNKIVNGKRETLNLDVADGVLYNELVCVNLDNGLKLTMQFRRFASEGITYYAWQYTASVRMILHYPIMVIKKGDKNKLILLTLPNGFANYTVNFQLGVGNLIFKDKYAYGNYDYKFSYLNVDTTNPEALNEAINTIKQYYIDNYNGIEENEVFKFKYLGKKFSIKFNEENFEIDYLEN
ncbi:MAG: hypothetical protein ACOX4W_04255 [Bacilli bacterium]